jgi:hypothetical protein
LVFNFSLGKKGDCVMKKLTVLFMVLGVFLFAGNAGAALVELGPSTSSKETAVVIPAGYVQIADEVYPADAIGELFVQEGQAACSHTVGTYEAGDGMVGLYMTSNDGTFYSEVDKNYTAPKYEGFSFDHFATYYNETTGDYFWAIEDQNQTKTGRSWLDHDYNDVTATTATATPIPGAVWLLGSGLVGLVGVRKFRR